MTGHTSLGITKLHTFFRDTSNRRMDGAEAIKTVFAE
jgi:hypothetical protein